MDDKAVEINTGAHDRTRKDHYNVEQGGSVLGTIQKPPETEQEALHLTPGFNKEVNQIVQHAEGGKPNPSSVEVHNHSGGVD